jgi:hypothetical protein
VAFEQRGPYMGSMRFTTHFYAEPSAPNVLPYPISNPSGEFDGIEQARLTASSAADLPTIQAHSIEIQSEDGSIVEHWERDGDRRRRIDSICQQERTQMAIATAVQQGTYVRVYNERGGMIFSIPSGNGPKDGLQGYTGTTVSVRVGGYVRVYNEKGRMIQSIPTR